MSEGIGDRAADFRISSRIYMLQVAGGRAETALSPRKNVAKMGLIEWRLAAATTTLFALYFGCYSPLHLKDATRQRGTIAVPLFIL